MKPFKNKRCQLLIQENRANSGCCLQVHSRGSIGSLPNASNANTHSCTSRGGARATTAATRSLPSSFQIASGHQDAWAAQRDRHRHTSQEAGHKPKSSPDKFNAFKLAFNDSSTTSLECDSGILKKWHPFAFSCERCALTINPPSAKILLAGSSMSRSCLKMGIK